MPFSDFNICLATVTTDEFVPGTMVMLHSFLKHNRWFEGDIVIIHNALNSTYQQYLSQCFARVQFLPVADELKACLKPVLLCRPDLVPKQARFYCLETFRLRGYDKVLYYDSDILFRGSIEELFKKDEALICCGDAPYYFGGCRDQTSLIALPASNCHENGVLRNTFNSGFLLLDTTLLNDYCYAGLLNLLDEKTYRHMRATLTDQAIFNLYFAGQQHLVSCTYNYLLQHRSGIYAKEQISFTKARALHFCGPAKPWQANSMLYQIQRDPAFIKASEFWYSEYLECLQRLHLKQNVLI